MVLLSLHSPTDILRHVSQRVRARRLERAWTQAELAERSGVSLATLRRFERTGEGPFALVVQVALALGAAEGLLALFPPPEVQAIEDVLEKPSRQRGRRR
jgi:transcriptional regulator with XRE-family HTH domain